MNKKIKRREMLAKLGAASLAGAAFTTLGTMSGRIACGGIGKPTIEEIPPEPILNAWPANYKRISVAQNVHDWMKERAEQIAREAGPYFGEFLHNGLKERLPEGYKLTGLDTAARDYIHHIDDEGCRHVASEAKTYSLASKLDGYDPKWQAWRLADRMVKPRDTTVTNILLAKGETIPELFLYSEPWHEHTNDDIMQTASGRPLYFVYAPYSNGDIRLQAFVYLCRNPARYMGGIRAQFGDKLEQDLCSTIGPIDWSCLEC